MHAQVITDSMIVLASPIGPTERLEGHTPKQIGST